MFECQLLMEVRLGKPVYAVDTAQNGRLVVVGGAGSKMLLNVLSWLPGGKHSHVEKATMSYIIPEWKFCKQEKNRKRYLVTTCTSSRLNNKTYTEKRRILRLVNWFTHRFIFNWNYSPRVHIKLAKFGFVLNHRWTGCWKSKQRKGNFKARTPVTAARTLNYDLTVRKCVMLQLLITVKWPGHCLYDLWLALVSWMPMLIDFLFLDSTVTLSHSQYMQYTLHCNVL